MKEFFSRELWGTYLAMNGVGQVAGGFTGPEKRTGFRNAGLSCIDMPVQSSQGSKSHFDP